MRIIDLHHCFVSSLSAAISVGRTLCCRANRMHPTGSSQARSIKITSLAPTKATLYSATTRVFRVYRSLGMVKMKRARSCCYQYAKHACRRPTQLVSRNIVPLTVAAVLLSTAGSSHASNGPIGTKIDEPKNNIKYVDLYEKRQFNLILIEMQVDGDGQLTQLVNTDRLAEKIRSFLLKELPDSQNVQITPTYLGDSRQNLSTTITIQISIAIRSTSLPGSAKYMLLTTIATNIFETNPGLAFFLLTPDGILVERNDRLLEQKIANVIAGRLAKEFLQKRPNNRDKRGKEEK
jgi:hypothetical protein